jgi:uncharacterized protein CbrC (UPF0167 family)
MSASILLMAFLSFGLWESLGHALQERSHNHCTGIVKHSSHLAFGAKECEEQHNEATCPLCAAIHSSVATITAQSSFDAVSLIASHISVVDMQLKQAPLVFSSPRSPPLA